MGFFGNSQEKEAKRREEEQRRQGEMAKTLEIDREKEEIKSRIASLRAERDGYLDQAGRILDAVKPDIVRLNQDRAVKWEYLQLLDPTGGRLDEAGEVGWELVGISSYETGVGGNLTVHMHYTFKRSLVPESEYPPELTRKFQPAGELLERCKELLSEIEELSSRFDAL
jgi:hypothetical protein